MAYKRLIEHRLPLNEVSTESAREKSIRHGHISTLHIWWARRPLAASRAAVFATLVPDTDENYELVKKIVPWEAVKDGNNADILEARRRVLEANGGVPPKVLDPFGGGGAIPLEALRLGCEVYSLDLNPVAHIIQKATLEFPQKFGQPNSRPVPEYILEKDRQAAASTTAKASAKNKGKASKQVSMFGDSEGEWEKAYKQNPLATDVRYWGEWVLEKARAELQEFYPPDEDGKVPVAYLWARTVTCTNPACRAEVPMVRQWWLAKKTGKSLALKPRVNQQQKRVDFEVVEVGKGETWPDEGTIERGNSTCLACGTAIPSSEAREQAKSHRWGQRLMAVVLSTPNTQGKSYRPATEQDETLFEKAKAKLEHLKATETFDGLPLVPNEPIPYEPRAFTPCIYGFTEWGQLFNARQALSLVTFAKYVREAYAEAATQIGDEEYGKAVAVYLGIFQDRLADATSSLARWRNSVEAQANTFSRQALPMVWDYVEDNPTASDALEWITKSILMGGKTSESPAHVLRGSATRIPLGDGELDAVVTDPPYYDAIPYSDLSDYFYVWLKRTIGSKFREHFRTPTTPKAQEAVQNPIRHSGDNEKAKLFFEDMMAQAFVEMNRVLKPNGEATIVFAHKSTEAWETLIGALIRAGFRVEASWPLRTEKPGRMRALESAALASSTFLNCTKRTAGGVGYFNDVRREMIAAIQPQLAEFWASGIRGADFFMSAIGPGLEAYSKHDEVRRMSGEVVTVGEFLDEVRKIVMEFALEQVLGAKSLGTVDAPTQFALLALWGYGAELPSDEARKLAQSVGRELADIQGGGLVVVKGEKATVQGLKARSKDKGLGLSKSGEKVPMVDAMHKAVTLLGTGSRQAVADYLGGVGYLNEEAFWQTMQALAEVQEGVDDGRALHELLTIREGLPKPSGNPLETLFGGQA